MRQAQGLCAFWQTTIKMDREWKGTLGANAGIGSSSTVSLINLHVPELEPSKVINPPNVIHNHFLLMQ